MKTFPDSRLAVDLRYSPLRLPDLTSLDFFLWGYVMDQVYSTRKAALDDLKLRIHLAIQNVTIDMQCNNNNWRDGQLA